ncbi:MAG TPA: hypothetical protein VKT78_14590 [Fimbriimonadaceae bacterium]|nr:hypothetical protein [Fimbriimonadaceae bacterium]
MNAPGRLAGVGLSALLAASAGAQVTKNGNAYLFRLHLTKGEKLHFKVPFTISGYEAYNLRFGMFLKVLKVSSTGEATVHCKVETGAFNLTGRDPNGGTFTVDQRGRVGSDDHGASVGFCIVYPKDPVAVGGTFIAPVPAALGGGTAGTTSQATFKFLGFSGAGAHRCAKLTFTVQGNKDPGGSILVRMSDGVLEKYYTKFVATPQATGKPVTVTATFIRE